MSVPDSALLYLRDPAIADLWSVVAARLESRDLAVAGSVRVSLDAAGAAHLSGLLGRPVMAGNVTVKLADLDEKLRGMAGGIGLLPVVEQVRGVRLTDRRRVRAIRSEAAFELHRQLDNAVTGTALTPAKVQAFTQSVRSSGILTRAGDTAGVAIARFAAGWAELSASGALAPETEPTLLLGEFAFKFTGSSHGFDEGTDPSKLMMKALAVHFDEPVPENGEDRRRMWALAGISTDSVSGTALTWGFRPSGSHPWSVMMRARADLGLVTHLTVQELQVALGAGLVPPGSTVFVCENPQILQASAAVGVPSAVLCLSGAGSAASWTVLRQLIADGNPVKYHGDFDWPGVAIAGRVHSAGAELWRMGADDYVAAVAATSEREPLDGMRVETGWDTSLADAMAEHNTVVHEEALIRILLQDLIGTSGRI